MMDKECPLPEPFINVIKSILFLTLLFFLAFISRFIFAPLMPSLIQELGLSPSQAGSIFFISSIGVFMGSLSSGFLSSWITHKGTIAFSLFIAGLALLACTFFSSLGTIRVTMLCLGIASGLSLPSNIATITAIVSRQDWGKAMAVQQTAPTLSLILGPLLTVLLLSWFSWRAPLLCIAVFSIVASFTLMFFGKFGDFPGDAPNLSFAKSIFQNRSFWIMIILFALGMGGQVGVYAMLPLYLVSEGGMSAELSNTLLGMSQVTALFMTFFSGWVIDRIGEKRVIALSLIFSGIITIFLGVLSGTGLKIVVFLQPALIVCFFPAAFASLSRIVQPNLRSLASAWVTPTAFILGGGLFPVALGYMGQTYTFGLGMVLSGCLLILGSVLVYFLTLLDKLEEGC